MPVTSDEDIREILALERIAVVGCSTTPGKDAHEIPRYLRRQGYDIVPVNPNADVVLGRPAYDDLEEVAESVDILDVFRPSDEVSGIVDTALGRDDIAVIWLQLGIHDDVAVKRAEDTGLRVVQDRCMKPEHQRLVGTT